MASKLNSDSFLSFEIPQGLLSQWQWFGFLPWGKWNLLPLPCFAPTHHPRLDLSPDNNKHLDISTF